MVPQRRNLLRFCLGPFERARHSKCSCAPSLPWLGRSPHQLIEREQMVIGGVHSPEGVEVRLSIAMLLLPLGHLIAKVMPAEAVIRWAANSHARTNIRLRTVALEARLSYARVAT